MNAATGGTELRVLVPHAISPRAPAFGGQVHALSGLTMGTTWSVRLVGSSSLKLDAVTTAIEQVLAVIVAQMSTWEAGSDISRFNRAPAGQWQVLPLEFFEVLSCGLSVAQDSGGAYDPCAGALVNAWGFGPQGRHDEPGFQAPADAALASAHAVSGWARLEVDAAERRIRQPGGLQLDLSAIAKGHAVDAIVQMLAQRFGIEDVLAEVGGELRGSGLKPDGQPWWVDLEAAPRWVDGVLVADADLPPTRVALHGLSVATSGDYRRFFEREGRRYPHTIDPRSGQPIAHGMALVTVLHARCLMADALSTALTVLGPDDGGRRAEQHGIAALFVWRRADGRLQERMSTAFAALA